MLPRARIATSVARRPCNRHEKLLPSRYEDYFAVSGQPDSREEKGLPRWLLCRDQKFKNVFQLEPQAEQYGEQMPFRPVSLPR